MSASQQQSSTASSAAGVSVAVSAGGPGPPQQPQAPAQLVGPAQSGLLQQQQQDFDPVQRYKMLIPQLKESLQVRPGAARKPAGFGSPIPGAQTEGLFEQGESNRSVKRERGVRLVLWRPSAPRIDSLRWDRCGS